MSLTESRQATDVTPQVYVYGLASDGVVEPPTPTSTPVPQPTPTALPVVRAPTSIEALIAQYPWDASAATRVAQCESEMNPTAYNPASGASGLFQIVPRWHAWRLRSGESLFNAGVNTRVAFEIWNETGDWRQWSCRP